jgi:hypothetical protein
LRWVPYENRDDMVENAECVRYSSVEIVSKAVKSHYSSFYKISTCVYDIGGENKMGHYQSYHIRSLLSEKNLLHKKTVSVAQTVVY